MLMLEYLCYKT